MPAPPIAASIRIQAPAGEWFARHPEWWMLTLSLGAWLILAVAPWHQLVPFCTGAPVASAPYLSGWWAVAPAWPFAAEFVEWAVMIIAMMSPLVVLSVRHVAFRSFRKRRHYAIADFLLGYFGVWIVAGTALLLALSLGSLAANDRALIAVAGYSVAIAWQLTPWKRIALWRCHRTVALAPEGWQADAACIRFGMRIGGSCLQSCWALMALPALTSHGLGSMACIAAAMIHERYQQRLRPRIAGSVMLICAALLFELRGTLV
jgi:predicted metal-binding membrane protein